MDIKNIEAYYSSDPDWETEFNSFNEFKRNPVLNKLLKEATGPYPAGHGEDHVNQVIRIIDQLFNNKCKNKFSIQDVFNLLVAACIHDLAMIHLIPTGASGELAENERRMHSSEEYSRKIVDSSKILDFYIDRKEDIIKIASAHAHDKLKTVEDKILEIEKDGDIIDDDEKDKLIALIRLICIADYIDIGVGRLIFSADLINWDKEQQKHYDKHKILKKPDIKGDLIAVTLTDDAKKIVKNPGIELHVRLKILTDLQKVYYELEKHINKLNKALKTQWFIKPLNEDFFGRIFPLSYGGIQLHTTIFEKALLEPINNKGFEIDLLGHSLYSRFVDDEENLNEKLFSILKKEKTNVRILLLDPETELQQSCEIFDSQQKENRNRSILPLFDHNFDIKNDEAGDILKSLKKISTEWKVGDESKIKVKLTKKILYASITRYGDYMIVTPYTMGLSSQSISIVYSKESPIYDAFLKDFDLLWNKKDETRLSLSKVGANVKEVNPIKDIIIDNKQKNNQSHFNYENWLLKDELLKKRIRFWFEHEKDIIPPYELEIQPTNTCNLTCTHCIGRHLDYLNLKKSTLEISDIDRIKTILNWNEREFKIERLRISGLNGDPLSDDALEFTKALIARNDTEFKKEIVLFTNGLNIDKAIDDLLKIDSVHISLDAGTKETFEKIKGNDSFGIIIKNIEKLKAKKQLSKSKTKIGIGFVVTQRNYSEVYNILKVINDIGVDFIRFKRDIHLPNSISWRTWIETKNKIDKIIDNKIERINDNYPKIDNIYITDLPRQHWNGNTKKCISHKFCLTIGADGNIFTCDHLTSKSYTAIAKLSDSKLIDTITESLNNKSYCNKLKNCSQCPPFNFRFNYFIPQLKSLYVKGNWDNFNNKIAEYLKNDKIASI